MSELKPCPFCGGEAYYRSHLDPTVGECSTVRCDNMDCPVFPLVDREAGGDAITAWNTRASEADKS